MRARFASALFLLVSAPIALAAQQAPAHPVATTPQQARRSAGVEPGGIAVKVVTLQAPAGASVDSVRYRIEAAPGIRLFVPDSGAAAVAAGAVRLPLTFGVPPSARAGTLPAGRVVANWRGPRTEQAFSVDINAHYALRFRLGNHELTVSPGAPAALDYHLANRGNAVDTAIIRVRAPMDWQGVAVPDRVVLAPGDTAGGVVQLVASRTATPGEEQIVAVAALSHNGPDVRSAKLVVIGQQNWFGDLAYMPSSLFIGSSTAGGTGPGAALQVAGAVGEDTHLTLQYRYRDQPFAPPAFQRELSGPELRIGIQRPDWRLRAGEIYTTSDVFTGPALHGNGLHAVWMDSTHTASLSVARPTGFGLEPEDGHIVRATAGLKTRVGTFTVNALDYRRADVAFEGYGTTAGGIQYDYEKGQQRLSVLAGLMRVRSDSSGAATGAALEANYQFVGANGGLSADIRKVPATVANTSAYGNQLLLSGNRVLVGGLSALGWGYWNSTDILGTAGVTRSRGGGAGFRYRFAHRLQVQLTGNYRDSHSAVSDSLAVGSLYRTLRADLHVPIGGLTAQIDGEVGTGQNALTGPSPYRYATAGLQWARGRQWLWVGTSYQDIGVGDPFLYLDMSGAFDTGGVQIQAGLNGRIDHVTLTDAIGFWSGTTISIARVLDVTIGLDYQPTTVADRWRFSLGFGRKFNLPLPVHRQPAVQGVVFEDRNGNHVLDEGEPPLQGIPVYFGPLRTTTDARGRFEFMDPVQAGVLRIDPNDLPLGLRVPSDVHLPSAGEVDIPVIRTAALDVTLFVDANANGQRDAGEQPDTSAVVSLQGPTGHTRDIAVDNAGHARFTGLQPGKYTLTVHPAPTRRGPAPAIHRSLTIPSGTTLRETIAVPVQRLEIRMPGGATFEEGTGKVLRSTPRRGR